MGRPPILPPASEMFRDLAKGKYKDKAAIAKAYGVSKSAVTKALSPYEEEKIDYRGLMPWDFHTATDAYNPRPARMLRLHLKARLQNHNLSQKEADEHVVWIASLADRTLAYSEEKRWHYVPRTPDHNGLVAVLPEGVELPVETITLYERNEAS
ncbi:hypothetical protein [Streptomyces xanthochromogenes]|uniref:hypothetical protein n=1 Tax=Streptomyces xanthochromogenes TaxID=67384 RepID=UPI00380E8C35